ncbi:TIGR03668 family PPOX class F420-dependent oxidoreductase [Antribacter gilvus]|uniref:TIGR03668 family PPOX class F420-dependent oxidoreductase n=1 Tax=Antribacter gilvus TaxID=2304675 RepID=UPI000F7960F8|nr:TIGR03668 family PPOX class F420-dependent oxidoreductase [Antribacter gilvus]
MRLDPDECRERLGAARSAYLATVGADLAPHVVPVVFALADDVISIAVDQKPKTTTNLRRLRNLAENPRVAALCDHYADDWSQLWWVRADGIATVEEDGPVRQAAIDQLVRRYPQYDDDPPRGPVVRIAVTRWTGWAFR